MPNPPTRESCLECVDKHLGAALILITETRDGYPHRLRAIGHLHEAEDESQAWPELHDAIREARKRFQQFGEVPDFTAIESISTRLRGAMNPMGLASVPQQGLASNPSQSWVTPTSVAVVGGSAVAGGLLGAWIGGKKHRALGAGIGAVLGFVTIPPLVLR